MCKLSALEYKIISIATAAHLFVLTATLCDVMRVSLL